MYSETFLFKSGEGGNVIVNDGSDFTNDIFEGANLLLSSYRKILDSPSVLICPKDYEEDTIQSEERVNFHLADWLLVALEMDKDYEPRRALLINRYRQEEGFVFDFILEKSTAHFFRYFSIQETPDSDIFLQKDFLESISLDIEVKKDNDYREFDDYEEEEDNYFDHHPLPKRGFSPNRKNVIPNLGGAEIPEEPPVDEEEELEDFRIEVSRPEFSANKKGRPQNLNALDRDEKHEKQKARQRKEAEEEELGELHIEIQKPGFSAHKKGKPLNLNVLDHDEKYLKKTEKAKKETLKENDGQPLSPTPKPIYTPNSNKKPKNLDASEDYSNSSSFGERPVEKPDIHYRGPSYLAHETKKSELESVQAGIESEKDAAVLGPKRTRISGVVVENNYKVEPSFNLRPDVRHQEASLINDPDNKYSHASCSALYEKLKEIKTLRISANCLFVPEILPDTHEIFSLAKNFRVEGWILLALIHNEEEKPLCAILANRKDENLAILISFRHKDPRIMVISAKGIPLNDPAYPFYSHKNLLSVVKGQSPYKIGEN